MYSSPTQSSPLSSAGIHPSSPPSIIYLRPSTDHVSKAPHLIPVPYECPKSFSSHCIHPYHMQRRNHRLKKSADRYLVASLNQVVCQCFDCCSAISGNHVLVIVGDEDGLCSFDDDYSIFALWESNMSVIIILVCLYYLAIQFTYRSAVKTSVVSKCKEVFYFCYMQPLSI